MSASTFATRLHDLCCAEAVECVNDPDACAAMIGELVQQLGNAVVALSAGQQEPTRALADQISRCLPTIIFEKAKLVRDADARRQAQP